jgi:putative acetyltransferase
MKIEGLVSIQAEAPTQPDVVALLRQAECHSAALYPPESIHMLGIEDLTGPAIRFVVARLDGQAVGTGALVLEEGGRAELKRMFVREDARGRGIGRAILQTLEQMARRENISLVRLETGVKQPEAINLYEREGYAERGPFGAYRPDPYSVFMEKRLDVRQRS